MNDVFIVGYGLQSCLGHHINAAIDTLKTGCVETTMVSLSDGQTKPVYLIPNVKANDNANHVGITQWCEHSLQQVRAVLAECGASIETDLDDTELYLASSSLNMGGIQKVSQLTAPIHDFGDKLLSAIGSSKPATSVNTACTSGFNAIKLAFSQLNAKHQRNAVVVGFERFNAYTLFGFAALQLLAPNRAEPLGHGRQGLVLGEAIAALHLSTSKPSTSAWRVLACSNVVNGRDATGASTEALVQACLMTLTQANLSINDVDLIKLQAAGSPSNDAIEIAVLQQVFAQGLGELPPCVSLKMALGHTLGASGVAETALLLACIENNVWPDIAYETDSTVRVQLVSKASPIDSARIRTVMLITLGFGGGHSVLVLQRHQE